MGGGRWRQRERDRGFAKKNRQRQIEQEEIRFCGGTAETRSVYCKWCKDRVSVTGKGI